MSAAVNLLLLLTALLSALTGAHVSARPTQLAVAVAQAAEAHETARPALKSAAYRPVASLPDLVSVAHVLPTSAPVLVAPAFLSRRRE